MAVSPGLKRVLDKHEKRGTFKAKPASAKIIPFKPNKPIRRKISLRTPMGKRNKVWVEVVHKEDPRQVLLDQCGKIPVGVVQYTRILVAIYKPPIVEKTAGGLFLTQSMSEEDVEEYYWQGKVGLIVAMGPRCYQDDETHQFHGVENHVGDWVHFMPSNGQAIEVNQVFCRLFETERFINGVIPHPDYIW